LTNFLQISEKLGNFTVGIAGAGGLGSNCAVALARIGIGRLIIADFDVVSENNLNRQYYFCDQVGMKKVEALKANLVRVNPKTFTEVYEVKLNRTNIPVLFKNCDIIVEAFDVADQKEMLIETVLSEMPGKFLVVGLGMAGWGNSNSLKVVESDRLYICGDQVSEISETLPPLAPRVGIVANMQANTVAEIILNKLTVQDDHS
jgi:sulfur carrier protein ThiS adenylyltransferase